ncbi:MAG: hypothetical protein AAGD25_18995 [Cyanobacteria bacterium P01_F01_bin.150]
MGRKKLTLDAVNERLKQARVGLVVFQRGQKLSLRGTLPPRPGSGKIKSSQQMISLGVYASPAGLEHAESRALEIGALLAQKRFSWDEIERDRVDSDTCGEWVKAFKKYAFQNLITSTDEQRELDWKNRFWYPAFSKLDQKADLSPGAIIKAVEKTKPNSRSRQVCCQRMNKLAEFAGISVDLKPYRGSYSPKDVEREIPNDAEIEKAIDAMFNPQWQWIAAMMATFGLRDHECWYAELIEVTRDDRTSLMCEISDGKTGGRGPIPPLNPEWIKRWKLHEKRPPELTVRTNKEYGDRTGRAFKRQKNPHQPYSYRHAFAIRATLKYGFPTAVVAKWMGHEPSVFLQTYQKHITASQAVDAFFEKLG